MTRRQRNRRRRPGVLERKWPSRGSIKRIRGSEAAANQEAGPAGEALLKAGSRRRCWGGGAEDDERGERGKRRA